MKITSRILSLLTAALLAAQPVLADNMPQAARGHMGCSNTAADGMIPLGNGTGFCEVDPPDDCPLSQSSSNADIVCFTGYEAAGSRPVRWAVPYSGLPGAGAVITFAFTGDTVTCADDFVGSRAIAKTASTGTATFTIKKNGSTVGTAVFTASATGVLTTSGGATTYADGDIFEASAPGSQDATLEDVGITFECTR